MKRTIVLLLVVLLVIGLAACGGAEKKPEEEKAAEWSRTGYFTDEADNLLSIMTPEEFGDPDQEGWYVGGFLGEDMYGWFIPQEGNTLHGNIVPEYEEGEFVVTVSEEGKDGVKLETEKGDVYHFTPTELPEATVMVNINTEGMGEIAYAKEGEEPEFEEGYPYQSAYIGLAEPENYVFEARASEGWKFVKWTKDGKDFATEARINVELKESADFVAVFEAAEEGEAEKESQETAEKSEDGQNPAMNVIGKYQCDRAGALVEAEGADGAKVTIDWGSSVWDLTRWVMSGKFDPDTRTLTYDNCVKSELTYNSDGSLASETVDFENGTGRVTFNEDGTFTWADDKSDLGEMTFVWADAESEAEPEAENEAEPEAEEASEPEKTGNTMVFYDGDGNEVYLDEMTDGTYQYGDVLYYPGMDGVLRGSDDSVLYFSNPNQEEPEMTGNSLVVYDAEGNEVYVDEMSDGTYQLGDVLYYPGMEGILRGSDGTELYMSDPTA